MERIATIITASASIASTSGTFRTFTECKWFFLVTVADSSCGGITGSWCLALGGGLSSSFKKSASSLSE